MKTSEQLYICITCGSTDVYQDAWIGLNDDSILGPYDQCYCAKCEKECDVQLIELEI